MGDLRVLRPADLPPEDLERESLDASEPCEWEMQWTCINHEPAHVQVSR